MQNPLLVAVTTALPHVQQVITSTLHLPPTQLASIFLKTAWCNDRCDNITISPSLLGDLEASKEPLPRKLWPSMGGCDEKQLDMHASNKELFDKIHGEDQMAVDKLKEGIEGQS